MTPACSRLLPAAMAKTPIPRFLVTSLGAIALAAAFFIHLQRHGLPLDFSSDPGGVPVAPPGLLPPSPAPSPLPRPDVELMTRWGGTPVPEILAALPQPPVPEAAAVPLVFPEGEDRDPYLPRFVPVADGARPVPGPAVVAHGDFDGDGDLDAFVGRGMGLPSSLFRLEEDGGRSDVTLKAGLLDFLDLTGAAWVDFDLDGRLDLFVVADTVDPRYRLRLFRQSAPGKFTVLPVDLSPGGSPALRVRDFRWLDVDGDAFPDLLLSLDDGEGGALRLLLATPAAEANDWGYADATAALALDGVRGGGPVAWGDLDGDGRLELIAAAEGELSVLGREALSPFAPFVDLTAPLEIGGGIVAPAALGCEDLDGDGYLDLALVGGTEGAPAARAWWNVGGLRFREIPGGAGLVASAPILRMRWVDVEGNGRPGFLLGSAADPAASLLAPTAETRGDRARVVIHLTPPDHAVAPGARLTLVVRDENWTLFTLHRLVDEPEEIIGLGAAERLESLTIRWPDREGSRTEFGPLPVNHRLELGATPESVKATPLDPATPATDS